MANPSVTFFQVRTSEEKLRCVCKCVEHAFYQKQRVLIRVANQQVASYIDDLLWRYSHESFIPHVVSESPIQAAVVITTQDENLNEAQVLLNLKQDPYQQKPLPAQIYELMDLSDESKKRFSEERKSTYLGMDLDVPVVPFNSKAHYPGK